MNEIRVKIDAWGGDDVSVYFEIKRILMILNSPKRELSYFTNLKFDITSKQSRDDGIKKSQPKWAFVLTNGDETTIKLWNNANENSLEITNTESHTRYKLTEEECGIFKSEIDKQIKLFKDNVVYKSKSVDVPIKLGYKMIGNETMLRFDNEDDEE